MKSTILILSAILNTVIGFAPVQSSTRISTSLAFFGGAKKSTINKSSPLATEALELYDAKYNKPTKQYFFETWGMPASYEKPVNAKEGIFKRQNGDLISAFNIIAQLYGEDNALQMVKIQPGILAFRKENFAPSLAAFSEVFGEDESKEMVIRNPGLLSVNPKSAAAVDDLTMQLSYVVQYTRPVGNAGPALLLALVCVPGIESALGLERGAFLSSLFQ